MFEDLKGKVLAGIQQDNDGDGNGDRLVFTAWTGERYVMQHHQDCCESVYIEDICGDLNDVLNDFILLAEEVSDSKEIDYGSQTWTFYKLSTIKGSVTIRWIGESNGYYSESVDFNQIR